MTIEVTVLYHDKKTFKFGCDPNTAGEFEKINDEKEVSEELYKTIYSLINDEFPELKIDKDVIIEMKEFDD
jgi:hypothetical protein